jgi:ATP-dependent protease ClpP protease subunit
MASKLDIIRYYADSGVNIKDGSIDLVGDVAQDMFARTKLGLATLTYLDFQKVTVYLNTYGGCVYQGLAIYKELRRFAEESPEETAVTIIANGPCMSAGAWILQAADKRLAREGSYIMIHEGETFLDGSPSAVRDTLKHQEHIEKVYLEILAERSGVTKRKAKNWIKRESYFTPKEALKNNIIDGVTD